MASEMFLSLAVFLVILSFIYKNDNFIKIGIPFILIGITFTTESVNQTESFFITIFFILQMFLSLSLPEKLKIKAKKMKMLPLAIFTSGIYCMTIFLDSKVIESSNTVKSISSGSLKIEGDVYIIVLILLLILFSSIITKRDKKWN
jgi:hypothetical protein